MYQLPPISIVTSSGLTRSRTTITLSEQYRVAPSDDLLREIDGLSGVSQVELR